MTEFIQWLAGFLSAIGAINWGLVVFFDFDVVRFTQRRIAIPGLDKILYGLVGLSGLYLLLDLFRF